MTTCRSISPTAWEHAREALVFYFSRRLGLPNAEDMAQQTLLAVWARADYEFESEADFLRICYGFASNVLMAGFRDFKKQTHEAFDEALGSTHQVANRSNPAEMAIMLEEVLKIGKSKLREKEWALIQSAVDVDRSTMAVNMKMGDANNVRVQLHRARRKLSLLTGWQSK